MASYLYRTATTAYPCYIPVLGEFSRSWSYKTCRRKCKGLLLFVQIFFEFVYHFANIYGNVQCLAL